jgi:hypothetical protein
VRFFRTILVGAALAASTFAPAMAQTTTSGNQSGSTATSEVVFPTSSGSGTTNGTETIISKGNQPAPTMYAPAIGGLNACIIPASGAASGPGFGLALGYGMRDEECQLRNTAAVAATVLHDEPTAREVMCELDNFREAAKRAGHPCVEDQQRVAQAAPVARAVRVAMAQPVAAPVVKVAAVAPPQLHDAQGGMRPIGWTPPAWCAGDHPSLKKPGLVKYHEVMCTGFAIPANQG